MTSVSVVISAHNEEEKIARCLLSVKWAAEKIVIDSGSSDKTPVIAKKMGARVYRRLNNPMLNVNKNFGFQKAKSDWILSLDADEEIPEDLAAEILQKIARHVDTTGFWIPRKNIIFGKWIQHGLWWPDKQLRLFVRGKGKFPAKHVHEYVEVHGKTESLSNSFVHHNYDSVSQFLKKMDTLYTENEVKNLLASNYQPAWYDALRFPISDFVKIYFAQQGYKDGLHGLVLALLQACYSLVVFAKLWEKKQFRQEYVALTSIGEELTRTKHEIGYWYASAQIKESRSFLGKIWFKLLRRFS